MKEWDSYWVEDVMDCLPGDENIVLKEKLDVLWNQAIRSSISKSKEFAIVDLATGGGYLASLIDSIVHNHKVKLYATDASYKVKPIKTVKSQYKLLKGVYNDVLPFTNNSIDLIVSNFGFEYSNLISTIQESSRVLKAKAKMILNLHYKDSLLSEKALIISKAISAWQNSQELTELEQNTFLCKKNHLDTLKNDFKKYFDILKIIDQENKFGVSESGLIEPLLYCMKEKIYGTENADELFLRFKSTYELYKQRLLSQVESAFSNKDLMKIKNLFREEGMSIISIDFIKHENKILSVYIQIQAVK